MKIKFPFSIKHAAVISLPIAYTISFSSETESYFKKDSEELNELIPSHPFNRCNSMNKIIRNVYLIIKVTSNDQAMGNSQLMYKNKRNNNVGGSNLNKGSVCVIN